MIEASFKLVKRHPYASVLLTATVLACVLSGVIYYFFPYVLSPDKGWTLFGTKLTFLSILVAVGWLQYEYLYRIGNRFTSESIPSLDGWKVSKDNADKFEASIISIEQLGGNSAEFRKQLADQRTKLKEIEITKQNYLSWLEIQWRHFELTLSLLFSVIFILLFSVITDWFQNAGHQLHQFHENIVLIAISHGSFIAAIIIFSFLMFYYLRTVSFETHYYKTQTQKYREMKLG